MASFIRSAARALASGSRISTQVVTKSNKSTFVQMNGLRSEINQILRNTQQSAVLLQRSFATQNDKDLVQFLTEEIKVEKENHKALPKLEGFKVEFKGADVILTKEFQGEKIQVQFNVNHTVDSVTPDDGQSEEAPEMKSKPNFEVDITKPGGKNLSFSCSFIYGHNAEEVGQEQPDEIEDVFAIDEVTMYEGEWTEKNYAVAGDILDGQMYDLFMNMLDERGINAAFADGLSDYASSYEHQLYIKMLEDIQSFASK